MLDFIKKIIKRIRINKNERGGEQKRYKDGTECGYY